ncbi:cbb3-type cytochrome c oxidase subunit 3 [Pseudophaeobacter sp.]|uniref:cbb3-type cytochrome c oxidase subunit 3 n=1 Tax=Pseudophaeobacter sp. TaxID=1971739 RepID=UPI003296BD8D
MEIYTLLREFADSWMLLFLFSFFMVVVLWAFRPGSTKVYEDTASIPFRHVDAPAPEEAEATPAAHKEART